MLAQKNAPSARTPLIGWVALGAVVGLGLAIRLWYGPAIREDAYITLRYVRNLLADQGFVYNVGERVLGTTTPLYTLILTTLGRLGVGPTLSSVVVGIVADLGVVVVLFFLGSQIGSWTSGVMASLVYALMVPAVFYSVSGMETSLFTLTIVLAILAYSLGRVKATAGLAALCVWVRPDGLLLTTVLVASHVWRRRGNWLSAGMVFGGILLPWLAFAWWYFGSPVPQSLVAKLLYFGPPDRWYSLRSFFWYFGELEIRRLLPLAPLAVAGAVLFARRSQGLGLAVGWFVLYSLVYIAANRFVYPDMPFDWYYAPLLAPFALAVGASLGTMAQGIARFWRKGVLVTLTVLSMALLALYSPVLQGQRNYLQKILLGRERLYVELANRLAEYGIANQEVAAFEIGAFGYYYPGPIMDLGGLVSLKRGQHVPSFEEVRPAWLMCYDTSLSEDLRRSAWFRNEYRPVYRLQNWEGRWATLYRRYPPPGSNSSIPLHVTLGDTMQLISLEQMIETVGEAKVAVRLTLQWKALYPMSERRTVFVHLLDADGNKLAQQDNEPQEGTYPTSTWSLSEPVVDKYDFLLPAAALQEVRFLVIGAYLSDQPAFVLGWRSSEGIDLGPFLNLPFQAPMHPQYTVGAGLGHFARLLGYDLSPDSVAAGGNFRVVLYWEALGPADRDYTVFVHLLDGAGQVRAQQDNTPGRGRALTKHWRAASFVKDDYELRLPAHLSPGRYELEVGMYDRETGTRQPVSDASGQSIGDRVLLKPIAVR